MKRQGWQAMAWPAAVLLALVAVPRVSAQTGTVRCESRGADREQCAIDRGVRVELARQLSSNPCRQNVSWGVGTGYIWVNHGCRADFAVSSLGSVAPGGEYASQMQVRACRSEADRRLPEYSYDQIHAEGIRREGSTAWVGWEAGQAAGTCAVAANGRIVEFNTDGYGDDGAGATRITCESRSGGRQECPIPGGTKIRLVRQLSQNPCRLNDTFGRGSTYIWVAEGCRGEFEVRRIGGGGGGGGGTTQVSCESSGRGRQECPIPAGASPHLIRQVSAAPCRMGSTYGFTDRVIWVAGGCRAVFEVTRGGGGGDWQNGGGANVTRISCASRSTARQECEVPGATRVRLARQISANPCVLNQSFGIGFGHIWVSNGCRGEFDVTVGGPGDGTGVPGLPGGQRVMCESKGGERTECRIRSGASVTLVRQLSTSPCTLNSTWGRGTTLIWVSRGCRGEFEVR